MFQTCKTYGLGKAGSKECFQLSKVCLAGFDMKSLEHTSMCLTGEFRMAANILNHYIRFLPVEDVLH